MINLVTQAVAGSETRESCAVRERPILFSGAMVRAILEGRKTQTRLLAKLVNSITDRHERICIRTFADGIWQLSRRAMHTPTLRERFLIECPYGKPGDRLWVRETWTFVNMSSADGEVCVAYNADGPDLPNRPSIKVPESEITHLWEVRDIWSHRKRPSIFMPRWASRIILEITGVRVERLQDISEADARAEGCELTDELTGCAEDLPYYRDVYRVLWDVINGKKAPWSSNPWVWVIEFRRADPADSTEPRQTRASLSDSRGRSRTENSGLPQKDSE